MAGVQGVVIAPVLGANNAYITPYASSKGGGELLSEFNLRAALNAASQKSIKVDVPNVGTLTVNSAFTGCGKPESVRATFPLGSGDLAIEAGMCAIKGYFIHLMQSIIMHKTDIIDRPDMGTAESVTKLILLRLNFTEDASHNPHNERLLPPSGGMFNCVELVFTPPVVQGERNLEVFENELFLGTITRTADDQFILWDNPFKDGVFSSSQILWDKANTPWITPPDDDPRIYGVTAKSESAPEGLEDITPYLWLPYDSKLGKHLRSLTTNPEDAAGSDPLGLFVGYSGSEMKMWEIENDEEKFKVNFRVLQGGNKSVNPYGIKSLEIPVASYPYRQKPDIDPSRLAGSNAGLLDPATLMKLDDVISNIENMMMDGTEYGPFLDVVEMNSFINNTDIEFKPGDYCWVLNDEIETDGKKLTTSFGTVSGNAETTVYGKADTSTATFNITFQEDKTVPLKIFANATMTAAEQDIKLNVKEQSVTLNLENAKFIEGSQASVDLEMSQQSIAFEGSSGDVELTVVEPTEDPPPGTEIHAEGNGMFTFTSPGVITTQAVATKGSITGGITATADTFTIGGTIGGSEYAVQFTAPVLVDGTVELASGQQGIPVTGQLSQLNLSAAGNVAFTGEMTSFTQNVSARYVYSIKKELETHYSEESGKWVVSVHLVTDEQGNYVYAFQRQCVLRGFATPATYQYYGFVRPGSGANIGDVIMDETNHLALSPATLAKLNSVGWFYNDSPYPASNPYLVYPSTVATLEGTWFTQPVHLKLVGGPWDASIHILKKVRGDITLDISSADLATVGEDSVPPTILRCEDVSTIKIKADKDNSYRIDLVDCTVHPDNFNSIGLWDNSTFNSGSNTAILDNPWMTIENPFSQLLQYPHSIQTRFVSITRGKYDIEDAVLDVWVKLEDSSGLKLMDWKDPVILKSAENLNFPPLYIVFNENGTLSEETQYAPKDTLLKISGTGGTHKVWSGDTAVLSGSFVSTIDWIDGSKFSLVGRLTNPDQKQLHGLYDIRFRAHVQFVNKQDPIGSSIDYSTAQSYNPNIS